MISIILVAVLVFGAATADPPHTDRPIPEHHDQTPVIQNDGTLIMNDPPHTEPPVPAMPMKLTRNPEANNPEFTPSGQRLFEADMILSEEQIQGIYGYKGARKAINNLRSRWTDAIVPYRFLPVSEPDREVIQSGIKHWEDNTCIRFREVPANSNFPHLYFNKSEGCFSYIGMTYNMNGQEVSIGEGCGTMGTVAHELGHAIGFYHEQSRPDRDEYVKVLEYNVESKMLFNFDKQNDIDNYGLPYDLTSLMHYGLDYFTVNGEKTMVPLDTTKEFLIGQRDKLTFNDIKLANIIYKCGDRCQRKPNCRNDGFVTERCECKCPPGFEGAECQLQVALPSNSCGGTITSPTTVNSPDYPKNYPKDAKCIWVIQAPEGRKIQVTFNEFDVMYRYKDTNQCEWDYFEFRVGDSYTGQKYCAKELKNSSLSVPSNKAVMVFKSVYKGYKGFSAKIDFV